LYLIGSLTFGANLGLLSHHLDDANMVSTLSVVIYGLFGLLGVLFIIFGRLIYLFPLPITITSLVLYLTGASMELALKALTEPAQMATGSIRKILLVTAICPARLSIVLTVTGVVWKIIFIAAFASSIRTAAAYEEERRDKKNPISADNES
jgi:hypothetical protein